MFAVIEAQGHQYIVEAGMEISVDNLSLKEWEDSVTFDKVLAVFDEKATTVSVGTPLVEGAVVECSVINPLMKDKKIRVLKFKNKNRYKRVQWFRAQKTILKIKEVKING